MTNINPMYKKVFLVIALMITSVLALNINIITDIGESTENQHFIRFTQTNVINYTNCTISEDAVLIAGRSDLIGEQQTMYVTHLNEGFHTLDLQCQDNSSAIATDSITFLQLRPEDNMIYWIAFLLILISPFTVAYFGVLQFYLKIYQNAYVQIIIAILALSIITLANNSVNIFYNQALFLMGYAFYTLNVFIGLANAFIQTLDLFKQKKIKIL